jgi:hypothetical protein
MALLEVGYTFLPGPRAVNRQTSTRVKKLTPEQWRLALEQLSAKVPEFERAREQRDDPRTLARMATRADVRQPGTLVNVFGLPLGASGSASAAPNPGGQGAFIGTMVADLLFNHLAYDHGYVDGARDDAANDQQDGGDFGGGDF